MLKSYQQKQQDCQLLFIPSSKVNECRNISENYTAVLADVKTSIGSLPPKEIPSSYSGAVAVTTELKTITSLKNENNQIIIARYRPNLDIYGGMGNVQQEITIQISDCNVDTAITTPNNALGFFNNITGSGCNMRILSNNSI
jgi:hypothetical protein